jgi:hypothetical protein
MILIKKNIKSYLVENMKKNNLSNFCSSNIKCFLGQYYDTTLPKKITDVTRSGETKCFIKISLPDFDLINVHLTAYDKTGNIRIEELNKINDNISNERPTLIVGDFNIINPKHLNNNNYRNYIDNVKDEFFIATTEYSYILNELNWKDLSGNKKYVVNEINKTYYDREFYDIPMVKHNKIIYTNWTGFKVDYVFYCNKSGNNNVLKNIKPKISTIYDSSSDHIPLIIDTSIKINQNNVIENVKNHVHKLFSYNNYNLMGDKIFILEETLDHKNKENSNNNNLIIIETKNKVNEKYDIEKLKEHGFMYCVYVCLYHLSDINKQYNDEKTTLNFKGYIIEGLNCKKYDDIDNEKMLNLHNFQPLASCDWLEIDKIKDGHTCFKKISNFKDPWLTGTSYSAMFYGGKSGIYTYGGTTFGALANFYSEIMNNFLLVNDSKQGDYINLAKNYGLYYVFTIEKQDIIDNKLLVKFNPEDFAMREDYYYDNYDMIFNHATHPICKITRKSLKYNNGLYYSDILYLDSIYLIKNNITASTENPFKLSEDDIHNIETFYDNYNDGKGKYFYEKFIKEKIHNEMLPFIGMRSATLFGLKIWESSEIKGGNYEKYINNKQKYMFLNNLHK